MCFLIKYTGKHYSYDQHKIVITEYVKFLNIKPDAPENNMLLRFHDIENNSYKHSTLWYHLYKYTLKNN